MLQPFVVLLASGCFSPSDTGHDDATEGESSGENGAGTFSPESESSAPDEDTTAEDTTGASSGAGPQVVSSLPAAGDDDASLEPNFRLYFDRDVSLVDAVGRVRVSMNGGPEVDVFPVECWPDPAPNCIGGELGEEFIAEGDYVLPGDAALTIRIAADLPDSDGRTNDDDQLVEYRTFAFDRQFVAHTGWIGGITYDAGSSSLFFVDQSDGKQPTVVQRVTLTANGTPGMPAAVASLGENTGNGCDPTHATGGVLYVACNTTGQMFVHTELGGADLNATQSVVAPMEWGMLNGVASLGTVGGNVVFSGYGGHSITRLDPGGAWSVFHGGENLWADWFAWVSVAGATIDGVDYVFAAAQNHVYKMQVADASIVSDLLLDDDVYVDDIEIDSLGRMWLATYDGISVFDGKDAAHAPIAARPGVQASSIALREEGTTVHVYYAAAVDNVPIGHLAVEL